MKNVLKLSVAAAALVGLSACDQLGLNKAPAGNNAAATANTTTTGNGTAAADGSKPSDGAAAQPAAAPAGGQVTAAFLVGSWTDNNDCTQTIEFNSDGTFTTPNGNGMWALDGDRLTFQGSSTVSARIQAPDANTITLIHDNGQLGRSTRCPG